MRILSGLITAFLVFAWAGAAIAESLPEVTVWKDPNCGCCTGWVKHMRASGFKVAVKNVETMDVVKKLAGIPQKLESCHTAMVGKYKIEGHVPAADIKRLLTEKPNVDGLAVAGMPSGSPGMENGERDAYDVVAFGEKGTSVFSSHK